MKNIICAITVCFLSFTASYSVFSQSDLPPGVYDLGTPTSTTSIFTKKTDLIVDHEGNIWISLKRTTLSAYSLVRYNNGTWETFSKANSLLPSDSINDLYEFDEKLYVATDKGIAIYNNNQWSLFEGNASAITPEIKTIAVNQDKLYAGTNKGLLEYTFSSNSWNHYFHLNSDIISDTVQSLELTPDNNLWIGTKNGISFFDSQSWTNTSSQNSPLPDDNIQFMTLDKDNNLWFKILNSGIYRLNDDGIVFIDTILKNINTVQVKNFSKSPDGAIWFQSNDILIKLLDDHQHRFKSKSFNSPVLIAFHDQIVYFTAFQAGSLIKSNLNEAFLIPRQDSLKINKLTAQISSLGFNEYYDYFNPAITTSGSNTSLVFNTSLWYSAKNQDGQSYLTYNMFFHNNSSNFVSNFSGPITPENSTVLKDPTQWDFVWKINKSQIDFHKQHYNNPDYVMPWVIKNWPTHGDIYQGQTQHLAPYADTNNNGHYDPQLGDYPIVRGDQAIFFITNDDRKQNTGFDLPPLKVEIIGMAYAFDNPSDSLLSNTFFINYQIVNKSDNNYDSLKISLFSDFDIGQADNDLFGCDSVNNSFFAYNDTATEHSYYFGPHPPACGFVFLNQQLNGAINGFPFASSDYSQFFYPKSDQEALNWMNNKWVDGSPIVIGGLGYPGFPGATNQTTNYLFPGEVNNPDQWNALNSIEYINEFGNHDINGLGSVLIDDLAPNERICFDLAFVYARDFEGDHIASVNLLKNRIQDVQDFYDNNFLNDCMDIIPNAIEAYTPLKNTIKCYPNPTNGMIHIEYLAQSPQAKYHIFDLMGRCITSGYLNPETTAIDAKNLNPGLYVIRITDGNQSFTNKIIRN